MRRSLLTLALATVLLAAAPAFAQTGDGYDLTWSTIDGGGGVSTSSDGYSLQGTIGQPDAGAVGDASYTVEGGFWPGGGAIVTVVPAMTLLAMLFALGSWTVLSRRRQRLIA